MSITYLVKATLISLAEDTSDGGADIQDERSNDEGGAIPIRDSLVGRAPNVVPIKFLYVAADDTLWITDNYLNKTLAEPEGKSPGLGVCLVFRYARVLPG